jgi:riboflavin kinase / FMN adenylyltransferase
MLVYQSPHDRPKTSSVVAIGSFDGLHLGHQQLLATLKALSKQHHVPSIVYTFDVPTRVLLSGSKYLYTLAEKLLILEELGLHEVIAVPFTREFSQRSKAAFLADLKVLLPVALVVGSDFRFGHGRSGGITDLQHICNQVEVVPMQSHQGQEIHASDIRNALQSGEIATANGFLGRAFSARGVVVHGKALGRTINFPTANVALSEGKIIPPGVFVVRMKADNNQWYNGMANVGTRPTVDGVEEKLEVYLFDFDADLYGQEVCVEFLHHLRSEQKFNGLAALMEQLALDKQQAQEFFAD